MHTGPKSGGAAHPEWETLSSTRHDGRPCGTRWRFPAPSPDSNRKAGGSKTDSQGNTKLPPAETSIESASNVREVQRISLGGGIGCLGEALPEAPSDRAGRTVSSLWDGQGGHGGVGAWESRGANPSHLRLQLASESFTLRRSSQRVSCPCLESCLPPEVSHAEEVD